MSRAKSTPEQEAFGSALARALAKRRNDRGMTVRQVAASTGMSIDTIRTLESGRVASPGFQAVCALADALDVDLTALAAQVRADASAAAVRVTPTDTNTGSRARSARRRKGDR